MGEAEERVEANERIDAEERMIVRRWRFEQFIAMGFTETDSANLAEAHVDLSLARRMMAAGCPVEIASRILL
jgi:hypothetical protein